MRELPRDSPYLEKDRINASLKVARMQNPNSAPNLHMMACLNQAMTDNNSHHSKSLKLIENAIRSAFAQYEVQIPSEAPSGRGLAAGGPDPRRERERGDRALRERGGGGGGGKRPKKDESPKKLGHPDRAHEKSDGACRNCRDLGKGEGWHWNAACPHLEAARTLRAKHAE